MFWRRVFMRHCLWKAVCHLLISTEVPGFTATFVITTYTLFCRRETDRYAFSPFYTINSLFIYCFYCVRFRMTGDVCPLVVLPTTVVSKALDTYRPPKRTLFVLVFTIYILTCSGTLISLIHASVSMPSRRSSPTRNRSFPVSSSSLLRCGGPPDLYTFGFGVVTGTTIPINFSSLKIDVLHDRRITSVPILPGYPRNPKHVSSRVVSEHTILTHTII